MSHYNLSNLQTKFYMFSDGTEKNGDKVKTVPKIDPNTTVVTITPPVADNTLSYITGKAGLYATPAVASVPGTPLLVLWGDEPYGWEIVRSAQGSYVIYVPGEDRYWFDEFNVGIGNAFALKPGKDAVENQINFSIVEAA